MLYPILRSLLFKLQAEPSHDVALTALNNTPTPLLRAMSDKSLVDTSREVMGIKFPNVVGLAAGLDKNADYYPALAQFGFGFVEVGTVTPRPQPGNDKPRMFRLKEDQAVINRMGFNNKGVEYLAQQVRSKKFGGVLGINIGKNKQTPLANAHEDYQLCMHSVYPLADYITVNISSPNTPGLRDLQIGDATDQLLAAVKQTQQELTEKHGRYVPLAVKIAPDMADQDIADFCDTARTHKIDAIIAGNTTSARPTLQSDHTNETGGLSGKPLQDKARQTIVKLAQRLQKEIPIIGCGGIFSGADALDYLDAGASLLQVYTGLIYRGPALINEVRRSVAKNNIKE